MYRIEKRYVNSEGESFNDLRTIHIEKIDNFINKELVHCDSDENYRSIIVNSNHNRAFKIYNDLKKTRKDDKLIYELQKRQLNVKLTDFPTGIIVLDQDNDISKIIGQEIVFYNNSITASKYFLDEENIDYIKIYIDILKIIKELLNNNIYYGDIHSDNFVIDKESGIVKLIDFEPDDIEIENMNSYALKSSLYLLKNVIIELCEIGNIKLSKSLKNTNTLTELENYLYDESQKTLKH